MTVSHVSVKLVLHRHKPDPAVPTSGPGGDAPSSDGGAGASSSCHAGTSGHGVEDEGSASVLGGGEFKVDSSHGSDEAIPVSACALRMGRGYVKPTQPCRGRLPARGND